MIPDWLTVRRADTPLVLAMPHGGTDLPGEVADAVRSPWLARRDADWHVGQLYAGLADATVVATTIPRLFDGALPVFSIGSNGGATCDARLREAIAAVCLASGQSHVVDGRFRGGWTTRHYGRPADGVHAIQMELAIRAYLREPDRVTPDIWPPAFDPGFAAPLRATLADILSACLEFAR